MTSYAQRHMNDDLIGKRCFIRVPYQDEPDTGTILGVHNGGRSQHIRFLRDGQEQTSITCPQLIFLSPPVQVTIRDIFGECTVWEESEIAYR